MRINQYIAVLDACVLIPMPVADTLLRLAEEPEFYLPRWSEEILNETARNLVSKFSIDPKNVERRIATMKACFPEAMVDGYQELSKVMSNHPKDRHVLAAAIVSGAHAIVSNNTKHFPEECLAPYNMECLTADEFIGHQYHLDPDLFIAKLTEQAADIGWSLHQLISRHVPILSTLIATPPE
ncbi:MAG TPA: PIN domain-containing protein [Bryobacteraceae bacterium]|nr:PIN domain-containing protein [Bryobacteraceae bacterium]